MKNLALKSSVSALLTILAGVAAGMFFFTGKEGRKHRAYVKDLADKAKNEITEKLDELKNMDANAYFEVLDSLFERLEDATNPST